MPTTCRPRKRPHTDHVTDHTPTTYRQHTDHVPTTYRPRYRPHTDHVPTTYRPCTDHIPTTLSTTYRPRTDSIPTMYRQHSDRVPTLRLRYRPRKVMNSTEAVADSLVLADDGFALFHLVVQGCQVARLKGALPFLVDGGQGLPGLLGPLLPSRQLLLQPAVLFFPLLRHVIHGVRGFGRRGHFRVFFLEALCFLLARCVRFFRRSGFASRSLEEKALCDHGRSVFSLCARVAVPFQSQTLLVNGGVM